MEDKVKLSEMLRAYAEFREDPSNQERVDALASTVGRLHLRERLTMLDKQLAAVSIIARLDDNDKNAVATQMNLEILEIIYGLLSYCVNLEFDLPHETITNAWVVDALYDMGAVATIKSVCSEDYQSLLHIIEGALNFSNIFRIADSLAMFNEDAVKEFAKQTEELKKAVISTEKLNEMAKVYRDGDPVKRDIMDAIELSAQAAAAKAGGDEDPMAKPKDDATAGEGA